jgi:NAD(P)-dependent dehydrogenase (short-subunit alcohol dehydrogenase family)
MNTTNSGRTAIVTGGTEGIGHAVALALARAGDRVVFIARNVDRAATVLGQLDELAPGRGHMFIHADLSLLADTARATRRVLANCDRIDALVCCAGIFSTIPEWTEEGLERNLVLNYLSRHLMTRQLLPKLGLSPAGRVVLVSNAGRYPDTLDFDDLHVRSGKRGLFVAGRTQFANDLFTIELAERLRHSRVKVSCVYPGVTRTRVFKNARGLPWVLRKLEPLIMRLSAQPVEIAALTPVALARANDAGAESGDFYGPRMKPIDVPDRARRGDRRLALWRASDALVRTYLEHDGAGQRISARESAFA